MAEKKLIKVIKVKERRFTEDVLTVKEMMDAIRVRNGNLPVVVSSLGDRDTL